MSVVPVLFPKAGLPPAGPATREAVIIPFPRFARPNPVRVRLAVVPAVRPCRGVWAARVGGPPGHRVQAPAGSMLRLTRRGRVVLALTVLAGLLLVGWLGARMVYARSTVPVSAPAAVQVQPGDTLWSIARRVAPQADARAVVNQLQHRNRLTDSTLHPGQWLVIRPLDQAPDQARDWPGTAPETDPRSGP